MPAMIMLIITLCFAGLFLLPTLFKMSSAMVNFYWTGFWVFLALIATVAGLEQTLLLAGLDMRWATQAVLNGVSLAFVAFVVFAWFRLSGAVLIAGFKRLIKART
jgi:hypothetical protein